jgi:hypothetical protein
MLGMSYILFNIGSMYCTLIWDKRGVWGGLGRGFQGGTPRNCFWDILHGECGFHTILFPFPHSYVLATNLDFQHSYI